MVPRGSPRGRAGTRSHSSLSESLILALRAETLIWGAFACHWDKLTRTIRQKVESEVLRAVVGASPEFFEKLVVELSVATGYGGSLNVAGKALGKSGDGGIDGVINEDRLGFDAVYVQAKRWTDSTVDRPTVLSLAGSLLAQKGRKGVFITTSTFSKQTSEDRPDRLVGTGRLPS